MSALWVGLLVWWGLPMAPSTNSLLSGITYALNHAAQWGKWVVMVCPGESLSPCQKILAAALPRDAEFSGRTAQLRDGGRVSMVVSGQENFAFTGGDPFSVVFLGWGGVKESERMRPWRLAATEVLSPGAV